MQPKWDGFRLLVEVNTSSEIRGWSRHGADLTAGLGDLLDPFASTAHGTVFDGELVALADRGGRVIQDFAAVGRAALHRDRSAARGLHYVAFDLLELGRRDTRSLTLTERAQLLADVLPEAPRLRRSVSEPASPARHDTIVALGFEGTVLKRPRSTYRPGRQRTWRKYKARHHAPATVLRTGSARDGRRYAVCEPGDGRTITAGILGAAAPTGKLVDVVYSRVDANGALREARVARSATT